MFPISKTLLWSNQKLCNFKYLSYQLSASIHICHIWCIIKKYDKKNTFIMREKNNLKIEIRVYCRHHNKSNVFSPMILKVLSDFTGLLTHKHTHTHTNKHTHSHTNIYTQKYSWFQFLFMTQRPINIYFLSSDSFLC